MKYDKENDLLQIDVREAVMTARRGMSTYTVTDDEEPEFARPILPNGYLDTDKINLKFKTEIEDLIFLICGEALKIQNDEIHTLATIHTIKDAKKKEMIKQTRAEAFINAALYLKSTQVSYESLTLISVYFALDTKEIVIKKEHISSSKIIDFFNKCIQKLTKSGKAEIERVKIRIPSMKQIKFPYEKAREGQNEFIRASYRAIAKHSKLYATAPTGTGKTICALFPAIRALGNEKCDKVFYLTPKETTATAAEECIEKLSDSGAKIRAITLIAKNKLCRRGNVCKESIKLCETYANNKLSEAAMALFDANIPSVTHREISEYAKTYEVCPYELSLSYSELCDVIICDFNYLFDPQVYIRRFFSSSGNYAFLIDEAHNLTERAREMYSAEISFADISNTDFLTEASSLRKVSINAAKSFKNILVPLLKDETRKDKDGIIHGAFHSHVMPSEFYVIFETLLNAAEDELYANFSAKDEEKSTRISYLREYIFKIKKFYSAMCRFDECFQFFAFVDGKELKAKLFCIDTGKIINSRLDLGKSAVIFSATLSPISYYQSLLGADRTSDVLELDSPFAKEQLYAAIMNNITTRFSERDKSLLAICRVIAAALSSKRGNYMIFSPSFAYSEALYNAFKQKYPKIKTILQKPNMSKNERNDFLEEFYKSKGTYLAAFCVMGGIYAEGIDLSEDKLIGAIIVGIGMPSLSFEREAISQYYQEKSECGIEYAYLYPGMNRVLQAAGRVIRTENDRGIIVLIDDRFNDPLYKKIMPSLWSDIEFISDAKELKERIDKFWLDIDNEV